MPVLIDGRSSTQIVPDALAPYPTQVRDLLMAPDHQIRRACRAFAWHLEASEIEQSAPSCYASPRMSDDKTDRSGEFAERIAVHAQRPGFHISELRMEPGQRVPWHFHSNAPDTLFVLEGSVRITLQDPEEQVDLEIGRACGPIRPGRPDLVTNNGATTASFLVLQGPGEFDFVPSSD